MNTKIEARIEKLERLNYKPPIRPFAILSDEELGMAIDLLSKAIQTGQEQEWPEDLARKCASIPRQYDYLDDLDDDEIEKVIIRLEEELKLGPKSPL